MNSEFCYQALEMVGNPNVLINLVSRRVRQLNSGGSEGARPLVDDAATLGAADVALRELLEDKLDWGLLESIDTPSPPTKRKRKG